jgi:hypothetical protein
VTFNDFAIQSFGIAPTHKITVTVEQKSPAEDQQSEVEFEIHDRTADIWVWRNTVESVTNAYKKALAEWQAKQNDLELPPATTNLVIEKEAA